MQPSFSLTARLRLYSNGDHHLADSLLGEIFPKLRQIACAQISRKRPFESFSPTDLVDETWLLRLHKGRWTIDSREHFFAYAGKAMESVLIDLARRRQAERRGSGAVHVSLSDVTAPGQPVAADAEQILVIGLLLEKLTRTDELTAYIVRQHYIAGFGLEDIAHETGLTLRQVRHRWEKGKLWMASRLGLRPATPRLRKALPDPGQSAPRIPPRP